MSAAIGDVAAVVFASMFYGALAFGRSVGQAFEQGRTALMLEGIPEATTPVLLVRPGVDSLAISFVNRTPISPVLPSVAVEILQAAVMCNTPINFVRYDGGLVIAAGSVKFDSGFDLAKAALLDHATTMLVQVGWIKEIEDGIFHVTHAGYEAANRMAGRINPEFIAVKEQMPELIAEMKADLEREDDKQVREFFVLQKKSHRIGGTEKRRFIYFEEDHSNLRGKLDILENYGYLINVTPRNTPIYRMTEKFVSLILKQG